MCVGGFLKAEQCPVITLGLYVLLRDVPHFLDVNGMTSRILFSLFFFFDSTLCFSLHGGTAKI